MDRRGTESEARFRAYVGALIDVIGHADRAEPLSDYCTGLLLPIERKSVEPLAAVTAPQRVRVIRALVLAMPKTAAIRQGRRSGRSGSGRYK